MPFSLILFFLSIGVIFFSDVFIVYNTPLLSFFLVLLMPIFLFLSAKTEKKKIYLPVKETFFYLLFIIFSVISTFFAIDKEIAFQSLLIYIAGYLFFIFSFNYQDEIKKKIKPLLIIISIFSILIFILDYLLKLSLFKEGASIFYTGYQHNQLGNLLALGFIVTFPDVLSLFFFIGVLFSYSRTAYFVLSLIIIIQTLKNKIEKKSLVIGTFLILIIGLFYFLTSKNILFTKNKKTLGYRNIYFSYALSSIRELPLFGVGPGNFYYAASKRQVNYGENTATAHNIVLNVLAENGVLAGTFFILFILLIVYRRKKNTNFLLFLALSLIFMFDFSYHYNIFLVLWFIFGGLVLDLKKKREINIIPYSLTIFICVQIILFGHILLNRGLWKQSLLVYPLQKKAYETAIEENIKQKDRSQALNYLKKYDQLFGQSFTVVFEEIKYYQDLDKKKEIVEAYKKLLFLNPFITDTIQINMLNSYIDFYGEKKGRQEIGKILLDIKRIYNIINPKNIIFKKWMIFTNVIN
jgi:O-antigen ligase